MKSIGYLFLICGFLAAAYTTALDVRSVRWLPFAIAAIAAAAGVIALKRAASGHARSIDVLESNRSALRESIDKVVKATETLRDDASITGEALRTAIDDTLRNDLRRFADARESMVHLYGLQTYADIMSSFAAGERYINRVWSASADGYSDEAAAYLERAVAQFADTRAQLAKASN
jgi:hypothetical protein